MRRDPNAHSDQSASRSAAMQRNGPSDSAAWCRLVHEARL